MTFRIPCQMALKLSPRPCITSRFDAGELWGDAAEANQSLFIDMWESYLEQA